MKQGKPYPLGPTLTDDGVNFSIFSAHAKAMHLLLFDSENASAASRVISLDPKLNRTGHYWHIEVPGILPGGLCVPCGWGLRARVRIPLRS